MNEHDYQEKVNTDINKALENHRDDIKELYEHAKVANDEMGAIKTAVEVINNDITWIKKTVESVDTRTWWILGSVVIGIFAQILISVMK